MARLFLSYDRQDAAKAAAIAQVLEQAGHSVWWDQHIGGGTEYAREIEQALEAADAVLVLWSRNSVRSVWVRDEAAFGRDRGRLVPVQLDEVAAPLGFRQYQSIDLSKWNARGKPPLEPVLAAIARLASGDLSLSEARVRNPSPAPATARRPLILFILVPVAVAAAAIAGGAWKPWDRKPEAPLVAVTAASPDQAAQALARDLLIKLGVLQSAHADALQLVDIGSPRVPDFIIKVGRADEDIAAKANLMFVDNRAGTLLWSKEFDDPGGNPADLRQQVAYSAAQVLDCATQAQTDSGQALKLPTLKLYLSGCADISNLLAQDPQAAIALFTKVTEQAPNFAGGWKKLLLAEVQAFRVSARADQALRLSIKDHIARARRLDPSMAEAFLAEAWLSPPRPIAAWMNLVDRAVAEDPNNPEILSYRSLALTNVGLMRRSLEDTRRAVKANPLSPAARDALIVALLNSGEVEAAKVELAKAERLWPGATTVVQARFAFEFREGDPVQALHLMRSGDLGAAYSSAHPAHEHFLRARITRLSSDRQLAIRSAEAFYRQDPSAAWVYARALSEFGDREKLIEFLLTGDISIPYATTWVLYRPDFAELHRDPRFMQVARRFGALDYWVSTGKWPDFCARSDLPYDCGTEAAKLS